MLLLEFETGPSGTAKPASIAVLCHLSIAALFASGAEPMVSNWEGVGNADRASEALLRIEPRAARGTGGDGVGGLAGPWSHSLIALCKRSTC